jgi:hypothetical protein
MIPPESSYFTALATGYFARSACHFLTSSGLFEKEKEQGDITQYGRKKGTKKEKKKGTSLNMEGL